MTAFNQTYKALFPHPVCFPPSIAELKVYKSMYDEGKGKVKK
jgi:hypothetical protein